MKKVLLINQGLSANLGDKAILYALKDFFTEKKYQVEVAGYTQLTEQKIKDIKLEAYKVVRKIDIPIWLKWNFWGRRKLKKYMKNFKQVYDYIIIGGGQLIKTNCYFPYAFVEWSKFAKSYGNKCYVIGVGVDNNLTQYEKRCYSNSLRLYDKVIVRDQNSKNILKNECNIIADVMPDVAFLLSGKIKIHSNYQKKGLIMPFDYNTYKYHFKNKKTESEYLNYWKTLIENLISNGYSITLGYTTPEDKRQTQLVYESLGEIKKIVVFEETDTLEQLIKVMSCVSDIYASRMHALILAMLSGCTVHCISISDKLRAFEKEYINNSNIFEMKYKIREKINGLIE